MIVMAIRHKVRDFDAWKTVYDTFPPTAAGALRAREPRPDDANDVLIVSGWNPLTDARHSRRTPSSAKRWLPRACSGCPVEVYEQVEVLGG